MSKITYGDYQVYMDGIKSHIDPQTLVAINKGRPGTVPNLGEMFEDVE